MDDLAEFKQTYFQECEDLLADLEGQLTALQDGETDDEILNAAFRAIHSIKGGAGAFGFTRLVGFAHVFETVLDQMREHRLETSGANVSLLIRSGDVLTDLVTAAQNDEEPPEDLGREILENLHALAGTDADADDDDDDFFDDIDFGDANQPSTSEGGGDQKAAAGQVFNIAFVATPQLFNRANDPLILIRELKSLGTLETSVDDSALPALAEIEADGSYLTWSFRLTTSSSKEDIQSVFEFVLDDCELSIEEEIEDDQDEEEENELVAVESSDTPNKQEKESSAPARQASKSPAETKKAPASIRVDLERIDRLVNMVGELVITQAMLREQVKQLPTKEQADLLHDVESLDLQMRELQDGVMSIRAQPVKSVFSRMTRLVRELSASLNKEAKLVINGENTEIDKTVIEELADPLTHMIRNSMDHGLETPDEREKSGKPREGTIRLAAEHRNGKIVISVGDDGRGINRNKVFKKAVEKGLISAEATPSDDEIDNLILLPGFSTADQVSDVSGRGVGMDVVVRKIQNMGGRIGITSVPGKSSQFNLTLPLTLAVLDGMIIRVGDEFYIIPITSIVESLRPDSNSVHELPSGGDVLSIRGGFINLVHLAKLFSIQPKSERADDRLIVVVETGASGPIGLVVDELVGQQQVVIKSLESNYRRVEGVAGATILGNGMVALILDVDGIHAMSHKGRRPSADLSPAPAAELTF